MPERAPSIAIVEDDATLAFMMEEMCRSAGLDVVGCVTNVEDAVTLVKTQTPDILLLDFNLDGDRNGLELIGDVKAIHPAMRTVLVTGWDINDIAARMEGAQPDRILRKPVLPHVLMDVVAQVRPKGAVAGPSDRS